MSLDMFSYLTKRPLNRGPAYPATIDVLHALSLRVKIVLVVCHVGQIDGFDGLAVCLSHRPFLAMLLGQVYESLFRTPDDKPVGKIEIGRHARTCGPYGGRVRLKCRRIASIFCSGVRSAANCGGGFNP